jgi:hypothetical protein
LHDVRFVTGTCIPLDDTFESTQIAIVVAVDMQVTRILRGGSQPLVVMLVFQALAMIPVAVNSFRGYTDCRKSSHPFQAPNQQNPLLLQHRHCKQSWPMGSAADPTASLTKMSATTTISDNAIWGIRLASVLCSYIGAVAWVDRPRGSLLEWRDDTIPTGKDAVTANATIGTLESYSRVLQIRPSTVPGGGMGLFATADLPRGTVLGTYPGVVVPLTQNMGKLRQYPECEGYIWRFSDNCYVIDPTNGYGRLETKCCGGSGWYPGSARFVPLLWSARAVPTTLCRINEPPRGSDVNVVTEEDSADRTVTFALERNVMAGEELFIDYGLSYDRSAYGKAKE